MPTVEYPNDYQLSTRNLTNPGRFFRRLVSGCPTPPDTLLQKPAAITTSQAIHQLRLVLRRQHKSLSTEKSYTFWLRRYIPAVLLMPRNLSSEQKLERYLSDLARDRDVSASTQNQAFNALRFFYRDLLGQDLGNVDALRAQRPVHERHAPTIAETQSLLQTVGNEGG